MNQIRVHLPESQGEVKSAFDYIIEEGLTMSLSLIIAKLSSDIQNPLLVSNTVELNSIEKHTLAFRRFLWRYKEGGLRAP